MTRISRLSIVLIALALTIFLLGYILGDPLLILREAATVCLECIGVS